MIDQDRINQFADCTEDHQYIHVDPERAKETAFGGTIAHGFLTLSMLPRLLALAAWPQADNKKMGINYGFDKVRFLSPVPSGKRIRGLFRLTAMEEKRPGQFQQVIECTVEIEGGSKPALIVEWIVQFMV
jgi:acyl dehydratase